MDDIVAAPGIVVPASAVELRAVRASGPGGQNVNKVASKVELHVDLERILGLPEPARRRLLALAGSRLDKDGRLLVTAQRFRDQPRNLEDARDKLRELIGRALEVQKPRHATRATASSRRRRLEGKKRDAMKKRLRRAGSDRED